MIYIPFLGVTAPEPPVSDATLLLHFEGADGETNIVDSSVHAWTMTGHDACKISTAQSKWGTSSLRISRIVSIKGMAAIPLSTVLANGVNDPWWIEFWIYPVSAVTSQSLVVFTHVTDAGDENRLAFFKSVEPKFYSQAQWAIGVESPFPYLPELPANTWSHVALGFDGTTERRFVNGVVGYSIVRSALPGAATKGVAHVGGYPSNTNTTPDGTTEIYIDELRFILGSCPYTSDFTPPTGPYV